MIENMGFTARVENVAKHGVYANSRLLEVCFLANALKSLITSLNLAIHLIFQTIFFNQKKIFTYYTLDTLSDDRKDDV